jgi:hypothetical protein
MERFMVPDTTPTPSKVIYVYVPERPKAPDFDTIMYRIPGRSAARGEVTHKMFKDMNRKERRAIISGKQR